jgi:protein-disulfide isomerase
MSNNNNTLITIALGVSVLMGTSGAILGGIGFMQSQENMKAVIELKPLVSSVSNLSNETLSLRTKVENGSNDVIDTKSIETFIMNNPDLLIKSLTKFRMEQEAQGGGAATQVQPTSDNGTQFATELLNDSNDPFIGNPNGSHVITVFSDYNCGHCKLLETVFDEWLSVDPEAKLIVKEFPIFQNQPTSMSAAVIGTALFKIDPAKYAEFHKSAMKTQPLTVDAVNSIMERIGVSVVEIKENAKMAETQIEKNRTLGTKLNVGGTPTFFINGGLRSGGSNHSVESLMGFFN